MSDDQPRLSTPADQPLIDATIRAQRYEMEAEAYKAVLKGGGWSDAQLISCVIEHVNKTKAEARALT